MFSKGRSPYHDGPVSEQSIFIYTQLQFDHSMFGMMALNYKPLVVFNFKKKHKTITAFIWFSPSNETTHTMLIPPFFFEYYLQESMPFGIPWASDTRIMYEFNSSQCNPLHFFVFFVSFCFGVNAVLKY